VDEATRNEQFTLGQSSADRLCERLGLSGIGANGGVAASLVQRRMRRDDAGTPDAIASMIRNPETLEARGIGEDLCAAIEGRQLFVGDVAVTATAQRRQREVVAAPRQRGLDTPRFLRQSRSRRKTYGRPASYF